MNIKVRKRCNVSKKKSNSKRNFSNNDDNCKDMASTNNNYSDNDTNNESI